MNIDIGKIISECLNNALIQHYFMKKREMTYDEKRLQEKNFSRMIGYCVLFKESEGIEEYMHLTDEKEQIQFLKLRIADKIGIPHHEIDSKIVLDMFITCYEEIGKEENIEPITEE